MNHDRCAYVGPALVMEDVVLEDHALLVADGRIESILPRGELSHSGNLKVVDLGQGILTPGFVDIHVHGAAGYSYDDGTAESYRSIGRALLSAGVTTALPTLASAPVPELMDSLEALRGFCPAGEGPWLPGAHLEGPYFSPVQRGAQNLEALRLPNDGSVDALFEHADAIKMMSFAPELEGAVELTGRLVAADIVAAAGHSDGTAADLERCEQAGLSHVIHVFSGQSTVRREGPWRVPGILEATLTSDSLTVEMIADGRHLPPLLMRMAYRGASGRLCIVSDATAGAGLRDGSRYLMAGEDFDVVDGVGMTLDRKAFGGSTTLLGFMLPMVRSALGTSLPETVAMATSVPARAARLVDIGHLRPGYWADLTVLDHDLVPRAVALRGVWQDVFTTEGMQV